VINGKPFRVIQPKDAFRRVAANPDHRIRSDDDGMVIVRKYHSEIVQIFIEAIQTEVKTNCRTA
jgi:hypothetical protein